MGTRRPELLEALNALYETARRVPLRQSPEAVTTDAHLELVK